MLYLIYREDTFLSTQKTSSCFYGSTTSPPLIASGITSSSLTASDTFWTRMVQSCSSSARWSISARARSSCGTGIWTSAACRPIRSKAKRTDTTLSWWERTTHSSSCRWTVRQTTYGRGTGTRHISRTTSASWRSSWRRPAPAAVPSS